MRSIPIPAPKSETLAPNSSSRRTNCPPHSGMERRDIKLLFVWSQMLVTDELRRRKRAVGLMFFDFVEALARLAEFFSPPSMKALQSASSAAIQVEASLAMDEGSIVGFDMMPRHGGSAGVTDQVESSRSLDNRAKVHQNLTWPQKREGKRFIHHKCVSRQRPGEGNFVSPT